MSPAERAAHAAAYEAQERYMREAAARDAAREVRS